MLISSLPIFFVAVISQESKNIAQWPRGHKYKKDDGSNDTQKFHVLVEDVV